MALKKVLYLIFYLKITPNFAHVALASGIILILAISASDGCVNSVEQLHPN
jgi:hypothetical protein